MKFAFAAMFVTRLLFGLGLVLLDLTVGWLLSTEPQTAGRWTLFWLLAALIGFVLYGTDQETAKDARRLAKN